MITLWTSKNKFFTEATLDQMKSPGTSLNKYRADLAERFRGAVEEVEKQVSATYAGYKAQHEQFVNHAAGNIDTQQAQLDSLEQQIKELRPAASQSSGGNDSISGVTFHIRSQRSLSCHTSCHSCHTQ